MDVDEPVFEVVAPLGVQRVDKVGFAAPLPDLSGKRIGFLWDNLFQGDLCFASISEALARRYQGMEFVGYENFGDIHGRDERAVLEELPERLRQHRIDAAVVGVGA